MAVDKQKCPTDKSVEGGWTYSIRVWHSLLGDHDAWTMFAGDVVMCDGSFFEWVTGFYGLGFAVLWHLGALISIECNWIVNFQISACLPRYQINVLVYSWACKRSGFWSFSRCKSINLCT